MIQVMGFVILLSLAIFMYVQYLGDKERFGIYKEVAKFNLLLALLNLILIFID